MPPKPRSSPLLLPTGPLPLPPRQVLARVAPGVAITPDPASLTAGDATGVTLTAAAVACANCTYAWALDTSCPFNAGKGTASGSTWTITAGLGGTEVISSTGKTTGFSCDATVTSTDEYDATSNATVTVQVGRAVVQLSQVRRACM
jgi:hypothetical protein